MDIEYFRDYCLSKNGATESFPFDDKVLVFKVKNKIFALANIVDFESINLKCEPIKALELRAEYDEVKPGYHMNKQHWNTVHVKERLNLSLITELIDHSYNLVVASLSNKLKNELRAKERK